MSIIEEIKEQQKKSLKNMSRKEKLAYFWDYYKIHTGVAIILLALVSVFTYQFVTDKDFAFYATLINVRFNNTNYELSDLLAEGFQEYAHIDPDKYQVYIDTSITISDDMSSQYDISNQEKMLAMTQAGIVSAVAADTKIFEAYAQNEYFYDLESLLTAEQLEKYGPYLYYTDAATFADPNDDTLHSEDELTNPADLTINHRDPSTMEKPVAVGFILTEDNLLADAGYYEYLSSPEYDYQGYPSDAVLGIPASNKEPELVIRFLEFLELG